VRPRRWVQQAASEKGVVIYGTSPPPDYFPSGDRRVSTGVPEHHGTETVLSANQAVISRSYQARPRPPQGARTADLLVASAQPRRGGRAGQNGSAPAGPRRG